MITEKQVFISYGLLTSETKIEIANINSIRVRKYDAFKEFLGWGVRYNDTESCFTVSGHDGLEIELKSGEKCLVGTQMPEALSKLITNLLLTGK